MKYIVKTGLAIALAGFAFVACDSKGSENDQANKIAELEQKLARLEATQSQAATPSNVQQVQQVDPANLGAFQFSEIEHDFGTINEGQVVEHTFKFVNTGESPLVINNITASCGCTTPEYTRAPIKPGDEGFVTVKFNSTAKPGAQAPTVSIQANTNPSITRLRLKGNVTPRGGAANNQFGPIKR
ncbi:hypothetical protein A3SI_01981 [Nitritalea halalkaliphila LW7]|uniref:DUF1573 domain-containing protein n=1 Tax=Nitritalea halalkaliphila LW7 TaxID=1189621 RepID=I5CAD4_9BACT|nr:DUF1573 domain-containing protein [Nitritalea halalkaliphila]EIM78786.1 hypothetical protein A3SI_01981 [Nitritalea halalkaliphila LW7]